MLDIHGRDERIDRVTLANELMRFGELEAVDGLSYLVSLDEGLPELYNLESYVAIVKDKSLLRQVIYGVAGDDAPLLPGRGRAVGHHQRRKPP
jgi:replicative DNA helicase